jgi:hypothetical protein
MPSGFEAMMTTADAIYLLCAVTSLLAAVLLFRQYRQRRTPLLFWSFLAFFGLAINNVLVLLDFGLLPAVDLALPRTLTGTVAVLVLVYGLTWEGA